MVGIDMIYDLHLLKLRVSGEEKMWSGSWGKLQQAQVRRCQTASVYAGERRGDNAGTQALWDDLNEGKAFV